MTAVVEAGGGVAVAGGVATGVAADAAPRVWPATKPLGSVMPNRVAQVAGSSPCAKKIDSEKRVLVGQAKGEVTYVGTAVALREAEASSWTTIWVKILAFSEKIVVYLM